MSYVNISGEIVDVSVDSDCEYPTITLGRRMWYVFRNSTEAGRAAVAYWKDVAKNNPKELACIVGDEAMVAWGLGQFAGPGNIQVDSLESWIGLWEDNPEEHWASYDGLELEGTLSKEAADELGFDADQREAVFYRYN